MIQMRSVVLKRQRSIFVALVTPTRAEVSLFGDAVIRPVPDLPASISLTIDLLTSEDEPVVL